MIVRIDERLFRSQDPAEVRPLVKLLRTLEGREDAVLTWPPDSDIGPGSPAHAWLEARQDEDRRGFQLVFEMGPLIAAGIPERPAMNGCHQPSKWRRSGTLDVRVVPGDASDWRALHLTVKDATDLIDEPVHLHFEDDINDYAFMMSLCPQTQLNDLKGLHDRPGRIVTHSGGTSALQRHFSPLAKRPMLTPAELRRLWRTWVLFDRDASSADALTTSETITALIKNIEEIYRVHGVPVTWICLQRREIESYIPDSGLRCLRPQSNYTFVDSILKWRRGGPEQQAWAWAFDLKKGLLGDLAATISPERRRELTRPKGWSELMPQDLKPPFNCLTGPERRKLRGGLGATWFNARLTQNPRPAWLEELGAEYERGPVDQIPRAALVQSIFDRV